MRVLTFINMLKKGRETDIAFTFGGDRFQACTFKMGMNGNEVARNLHILAENIKHDSCLYDVNNAPEETKFMIGQRVIYQNVICTICKPDRSDPTWAYWIYNPEKDYVHGVALISIKALPNGQL